MEKLLSAAHYLKYRLNAGSLHDVHSPFVYDLLETVIQDEIPYYAFEPIEALRSKALLNKEKIQVTDFGTGGVKQRNRNLSLQHIAAHFSKPKKYGQLLFRLVNHFKPLNILEIGTSLGFSTLYLASPYSESRVITLEGCPETAACAQRHFDMLKKNNIELIVGEFSSTLPQVLRRTEHFGFVYFDGNHREETTLEYFRACKNKIADDSLFVFDDIHISLGMSRAWDSIRHDPAVGLTIDLFQMGLAFFRKTMPKQHFTLKF